MGLTVTTPHFYGADRAGLASLLPPGFLLQENNAPWLGVVPDEDTWPEAGPALKKLALRVTKADAAASALLFSYFDDDLFRCIFYRGGRQAAACDSGGSWAKLGKVLDALFADALASNAFRYASRCVDLAEKVRLLEETVGTALLDYAPMPSRTVPRSDGVLNAVKAREAALKKRPNQCVLTELAPEEWPLDWQAQLGLYHRIRPAWRSWHTSELLFNFGESSFSFPRHPQLAFHNVLFDADGTPVDRFLLYSHTSGTLRSRGTSELDNLRPLWVTEAGEPVCLAGNFEIHRSAHGYGKNMTKSSVVCLREDDSIRWQYAPAGDRRISINCHTAEDGTITLYSAGNSNVSQDAFLARIDGETGALRCSRTVPAAENLDDLMPVEALRRFVYIAYRHQLVLLDEALNEVVRWDYDKPIHLWKKENIVGCLLWDQYYQDGKLRLYDLRTGACTEITPEIPVYVLALLPDGRFLGVNEAYTRLTVFDPAGRVISRHSAKSPGGFFRVRAEEDRICILEIRAPDTHGFISEELFDAASLHVWQLSNRA